ncbi:MAG: ComF family protein [Janthinobacterium lividum]
MRFPAPLLRPIVRSLAVAVGLALPPRCPGCGGVVGLDHRFCATCWQSLRFVAPPWCAGCNIPFTHDRGEGARCADCLARPPRHAGIRAAVAYGPIARRLVLRLKYGSRPAFAITAARAMVRWVPESCDLLVPVPLHRSRLWRRGFNQAALIATAIGRGSGVAADARLLERHRRTPVLRGMGGKERAAAVWAAFRIAPGARERLKGRHVALVDDVYTSGATTDACTAVLLRAGAASVTILCWARVLGEEGEWTGDGADW